ncbi:MAG: hypothetical protein NT005_02955 [Spirochaetes bacterium]|nr:hypothetical protein [Spirochaetota bacterium]
MRKIDYKARLEWDAQQRAEGRTEAQEHFQETIAARKPDLIPPPEAGSDRSKWYLALRGRGVDTAREAKAAGHYYVWRVTSGRYQQAILRALGLDLTDGELLAYLEHAFSTREYKEHAVEFEGRAYHWVSLQATARALPVLRVRSRDWMYQRFRKLVKAGVLFSHTIDITKDDVRPHPAEFNNTGRYTLYALDEKVMEVLKEPVETA